MELMHVHKTLHGRYAKSGKNLTAGPRTMEWDLTPFFQRFKQLGSLSGKTDTDFVRHMAGMLAAKMAELTPLTKLHVAERGRARAGWWPALLALGRKNAHTKHPNAGEGRILDNSKARQNPSIMIENSVSYIRNMKPYGIGWFYKAANSIERQMVVQLQLAYQKMINKSGFGVGGHM